MFGCCMRAAFCASRRKRSTNSRDAHGPAASSLTATSRSRLVLARAIDHAHAAFADQFEQFVVAELALGRIGQIQFQRFGRQQGQVARRAHASRCGTDCRRPDRRAPSRACAGSPADRRPSALSRDAAVFMRLHLAQDGVQRLLFGDKVFGRSDGVGQFFADQFAEALTQALERDHQGQRTRIQLACKVFVHARLRIVAEKRFERFVHLQVSGLARFAAQALERASEHFQRKAALIGFLG